MNDPYSDPLKKLSLSDPIHLMALGFGAGLSPKAPGTVGTIVAVPIVSLMHIFTISATIKECQRSRKMLKLKLNG